MEKNAPQKRKTKKTAVKKTKSGKKTAVKEIKKPSHSGDFEEKTSRVNDIRVRTLGSRSLEILEPAKSQNFKSSQTVTSPPAKIFGRGAGGYLRAIGRRKTAVAEAKIFPETEERKFIVNGIDANIYFPEFELQKIIFSPIKKTDPKISQENGVEITVKGGGKRGQAEAARLALSRALILMNPQFKNILKSQGFLSRDSRMVERKKFGLKKSRRAPQWAKR